MIKFLLPFIAITALAAPNESPTTGAVRVPTTRDFPTNVRWYGAVGNGTNNDTAAILAAVNAAQSGNALSPVVYFPPGVYILSTGIDVTNAITLTGDNFTGQFNANSKIVGPEIRYTGTNYALNCNAYRVQLHNLRFTSTTNAQYGVKLKGEECYIDYVNVGSELGFGFKIGFYAENASLSRMRDCIASDNTQIGIFLDNQTGACSGFLLDRCHVYNSPIGIKIGSNAPLTIDELIEESCQKGIYIDNSSFQGMTEHNLTISNAKYLNNPLAVPSFYPEGRFLFITNSNPGNPISIRNIVLKRNYVVNLLSSYDVEVHFNPDTPAITSVNFENNTFLGSSNAVVWTDTDYFIPTFVNNDYTALRTITLGDGTTLAPAPYLIQGHGSMILGNGTNQLRLLANTDGNNYIQPGTSILDTNANLVLAQRDTAAGLMASLQAYATNTLFKGLTMELDEPSITTIGNEIKILDGTHLIGMRFAPNPASTNYIQAGSGAGDANAYLTISRTFTTANLKGLSLNADSIRGLGDLQLLAPTPNLTLHTTGGDVSDGLLIFTDDIVGSARGSLGFGGTTNLQLVVNNGGLSNLVGGDVVWATGSGVIGKIASASGYTGTGTNALTDDGTFKPLGSVNATNVVWGQISGVISNQSDLWPYLTNIGSYTFTLPLTNSSSTVSIINNGISDALLRQGAGVSVIGRATNSTGNVADIVAGADNTFLSRISGAVGFNTLPDDISNQKLIVSTGGTTAGTRKQLNLIAGTNITLSAADNGGANRVDVTINSSATGGGGTNYVTTGFPTFGQSDFSTTTGDYVATDAYADIVFDQSGTPITMQTEVLGPGTYYIVATVQFNQYRNTGQLGYVKLHNTEDDTDLPNSERFSGPTVMSGGTTFYGEWVMTTMSKVTVVTSSRVKVMGKNGIAGDSTSVFRHAAASITWMRDTGTIETLNVNTFNISGSMTAPTVTASSSMSLAGKSITSWPLKRRIALYVPEQTDGVNCTNWTSAEVKGRPSFSGTAAEASNWALYNITLPGDIDQTQDIVLEKIRIFHDQADTANESFTISLYSAGDGQNEWTGSTTNPITFPLSGAGGSIQYYMDSASEVTLTGWKSVCTPGNNCIIKLARQGSVDASVQRSTVMSLVLRYMSTGN